VSETRPLGEQERLLNYLHVLGSLITTLVLHVRGRVDPDLVREALAWLQVQHPILRAHIRSRELVFRKLPPFVYLQPWFVLDGTPEIPLKVVDDPNPEAWRRVLSKELRSPIWSQRKPRVRLTIVRQSADSDLHHIVIAADHATIDAQSANMLGRQLLEFLADPAAARRQPPVEDTLPPPLESGQPKKPDSGKRGYEAAIRLPRRPVPRPRYETLIVSHHIGANATAELKATIRANRTTLHGAVTAAFLVSMRERYAIDEMSVLTTIDMRRLMKPPLPAETYGCYIDILRTRQSITGDFWATAREASFKLINTLAKDQGPASILTLPPWAFYRKELLGLITRNIRIDGLAVTTAGESGLDRNYGPYALDDVTMAVSLDIFGPSLFVIASERAGGIDLSIGYTAHAMSDEETKALTDRAIELLEAPKSERSPLLEQART
jgi:hypothetical protein